MVLQTILFVKTPMQKNIEPSKLAAVMLSAKWTAHITNEEKIYYVNQESQGEAFGNAWFVDSIVYKHLTWRSSPFGTS